MAPLIFGTTATEGNYWSSFTGVDLNHQRNKRHAILAGSTLERNRQLPLNVSTTKPNRNPAKHQNSGTILAMPEEYLNYTISDINGTIWAKVDGSIPYASLKWYYDGGLPMLYPIPPNTTNIHVLLNGLRIELEQLQQC